MAHAVRLRGIISFLEECQDSCSPIIACIDSLKQVFKFFKRNISAYLDDAISEPTPAGFLKYGSKIERNFGNLVVWKDEIDDEASHRLKLLFSLYSQLVIEIKKS